MSTSLISDNPPLFKKSFYFLFFIELWERFAYYGMQALLVLYMSRAFHFSDDKAYSIFGAFSALLYATLIIGGYLGDRFIGYKRALFIGIILFTIGYGLLAIGNIYYFYVGLGMIIIGNGFFKPSPAALLSLMHQQGDPKLERSFTFFYMSINIGALSAMILSGFTAHYFGWQYGFGLSVLGLLICLLMYFFGRPLIKDIGSQADHQSLSFRLILVLTIGIIIACLSASYLLLHLTLAKIILGIIGIITVVYFFNLTQGLERVERQRMVACFILILFSISFFTLYFQAPTSLNLFVDRNVSHDLLGVYIPTASFQALNPLWIIFIAPFLATTYQFLEQKKIYISIPYRFATGIILMGSGFILLAITRFLTLSPGIISPWWVVATYGILSLAELLIWALGLAMVSKLSPRRYIGFMMGMFYLGTSAAGIVAGQIAKLSSISVSMKMHPLDSMTIYTNAFFIYGIASIGVGFVAFWFAPRVKRLMHEN